MGKYFRKFRDIMKKYKQDKSTSAKVYDVLRVLVIGCMVLQALRGAWENVFMCALSLMLFVVPILLQDRFRIRLSKVLEIIILLFIFSGTILGEIYNFYGNFPYWDTILHVINGFLCAGIGFALIDLLNNNSRNLSLAPLYVALVAFCFSMTVGVCWEFFEYGVENILLKDTQKDTIVKTISSVALDENHSNRSVIVKKIGSTVIYDEDGKEITTIEGGYLDIGIHDTMKDLMVNFIGAASFSVLGYFYTKSRDRYKFTENFIPKRSYELQEAEEKELQTF
jgi:hypothetical protein